MTRDEALSWARQATWRFKSYYKYRFTFIADGEGFEAEASAGGDAGDIYKYEVEDPMTWDEICVAGEPYLEVTALDGKVIYEG